MRVGILGGGQLGRMLALAGYPLNIECRCFDPSPEAPAGQVCELITAPYEDQTALDRFLNSVDVVTYEFENVPAEATEYLAARTPVFPSLEALRISQDRINEKEFFQGNGLPVPSFAPVDSQHELTQAIDRIGLPAVLKTRRFGYDGKGQYVLRTMDDVNSAWEALGGVPLILEAFVPFDRELSIISVRSRQGEVAFYPLTENHHREGILRRSLAPAPGTTDALTEQARAIAQRTLTALEYVGVLAIELFQSGERLLINEMAPRVHNSGHWTIEGAETSQFENHLRAVAGLPLGSTAPRGVAGMLNLIGYTPSTESILSIEGAHLHLYAKAARPGRKLGHVTVRSDTLAELESILETLERLISAS